MQTIIAANIILWSSVFAYFMPAAVDKEMDNKDNTAAIHKIEYPSE